MADIRIIASADINVEAYLKILDASQAPAYTYPWYLDAMGLNWQLLVLDNYKAVMPLYPRSKFGIKYLPMPFFIQQFGLFADTHLSDEEIDTLSKFLKRRYTLIEYNLHLNGNAKQLSTHFACKERLNYELDISLPYDKIASNFNDQTRRNLKTALKSGHILEQDIPAVELIGLFKQYTGEKVKGINDTDYNRLIAFMNKLIATEKGKVIGIKNNSSTLLAAAFFILTPSRIISLFPASHPEGRQAQSMTHLLNRVLEQYCGKPMIFDFEGSMIETIARFYKGFGAIPQPYLQIAYNRLPWWVRWYKKT